ncbi:Cytochrome c oxidase subunit 7A1, mitochondrial [Myotis davidii]|uniref:Cytochrome c oxidase subunit 7A1, mitochondrial n=1 Tax=Myotis davidii TaxID=225400 RepID=L5LTF1_MYODS|nr:Cytochrome c oxidase subunit 7A1, mitochondrial [Myotis davidii]
MSGTSVVPGLGSSSSPAPCHFSYYYIPQGMLDCLFQSDPHWLHQGLPTATRCQVPMKASQALIRSFSSTARNRLENRVAEKQKLFQADNDLPVHLKGGGTDNILYRLTMGLCLGGEYRACSDWTAGGGLKLE